MQIPYTRRRFVETAALGTAGLGFLSKLPLLTAAEVKLAPNAVGFHDEIEPLVRLIEETPRQRLLEEIGRRIKEGTTYREILGALMLAGIRNIQPRPVGFQFHAVLVVNSAHLASINSPDSDRWLPIFWALDYFKSSQAADARQGNWTMGRVDEKAVPKPASARAAFISGMDAWDEAKVDAAAAGLARTGGAKGLFDLFCRYGARDYRDIGHKAIYVANSWRTLQTIGWHHAEPVLRSLGYALLKYNSGNPSENDYLSDRPGRKNLVRLKEIREDWLNGHTLPETTAVMLSSLRTNDWDDTAKVAVELINRGSAPQAIWDAMLKASAELMMRNANIISLHACTTTNALHYAFLHAGDPETRLYLLLQNASFLAFFRDDAEAASGIEIDKIEAEIPASLDEIFDELENDRAAAARKTFGYLQAGGDPKSFIDLAQRLIYLKGRDSHDYKYSSAVLEDSLHISPEHRNHFLAASVHWLKGSSLPDSGLVARTRAAL